MDGKPSNILDSKVSVQSETAQDFATLLEIGPKESRRVLLKLDAFLLPLLAVCYLLQFLDKSSLNYSTLLGLRTDVHLVGADYAWTASIFYFGYLAWLWPTSYLVVRFPIGRYLSFTVFAWAVTLICHAACSNWGGLMTARFFLGITEAAVAPGFSLITGMFFTRQEQPLRHGIWFMGNAVASIVGGVIAYGIGHMSTHLAHRRLLFLIFGAITAFWAGVMFLLLPDSPATPRFMNEKERSIAVACVADNKTGSSKDGNFQMFQVLDALKDPQAWFLTLYVFSVNLPNGGLTAFGSLIIQGFGYKGLKALLLQMPTGAAQFGFVLVGCLVASKVKSSRVITMIVLNIISIIGMVMMVALDDHHKSARLAGFCLALAFAANMPLGLSLVASNVAGFTKKSTVNAMLFIAYCVGNIAGPQFYLAKEEPRYPTGFRSSLVGFCLGVFFLFCLGAYYVFENKYRDRSQGAVFDTVLDSQEEISPELHREMTGPTNQVVQICPVN